MALQVYSSAGPILIRRSSSSSLSVVQNDALQGIKVQRGKGCVAGEYNYYAQRQQVMKRRERERERERQSMNFRVRSSLDATEAVVGRVTEVTMDTFWPIVKAAAHKTVVLDMYTQWCGPCKIIAPKYQQLSQKYDDVVFLKLDCNTENRPLAKELGLKVVPTFKILKDSKIVKEVTGAKIDDLVAAIETARSST